MAKSKPKKVAAKQPNSSRNPAEHLAAYKWAPGTSGNPNGRKPGVSWLQKHREVWDQKAHNRILRQLAAIQFGDDREMADAWLESVKDKLTILDAIVLRNNFKALTPDGDNIVKLMWEQADGKATMRIAGPDNGPVQIETWDTKRLSIDELRQLRELIEKATVKDGG